MSGHSFFLFPPSPLFKHSSILFASRSRRSLTAIMFTAFLASVADFLFHPFFIFLSLCTGTEKKERQNEADTMALYHFSSRAISAVQSVPVNCMQSSTATQPGSFSFFRRASGTLHGEHRLIQSGFCLILPAEKDICLFGL